MISLIVNDVCIICNKKYEVKLRTYKMSYILKIHGRKYITYQIEYPIRGEVSMFYLKYVVPFLNPNLIIHILNVGFNTNIQQDNIWIILLVISWSIIIDFIKDKIK